MPPTDNQPVVTLPQELRQKFVDLERRLWTLETVVAVCSVLAGLILSYLILFLSDRLWDTPVWLRVIISAGGAGVYLVRLPLVKPMDLETPRPAGVVESGQKKYRVWATVCLGSLNWSRNSIIRPTIHPRYIGPPFNRSPPRRLRSTFAKQWICGRAR